MPPPKWELQIKGIAGRDYEISAVRSTNDHGKMSWGWGGLDKIIFFSSSLGHNWIIPCTPERWQRAMALAKIMTDALNSNLFGDEQDPEDYSDFE